MLAFKHANELGLDPVDLYKHYIKPENRDRLARLLSSEENLGEELSVVLNGSEKKNPFIVGMGASADLIRFVGGSAAKIGLRAFFLKVVYTILIGALIVAALEWLYWRASAILQQASEIGHSYIQELHSDRFIETRKNTPELYCSLVLRISDGKSLCDPKDIIGRDE